MSDRSAQIKALGGRLSHARRQIMLDMYLKEELTLEEIGDEFGISRQRVGQIIGPQREKSHYGRKRQEERRRRIEEAHANVLNESTVAQEAERLGVKRESLYAAFARQGLKLAPEQREHGTYYRYRKGCRCTECVDAAKEEKLQRFIRGPSIHGTESAYQNYGCRCRPCRNAARAARRRRRRQKYDAL